MRRSQRTEVPQRGRSADHTTRISAKNGPSSRSRYRHQMCPALLLHSHSDVTESLGPAVIRRVPPLSSSPKGATDGKRGHAQAALSEQWSKEYEPQHEG